MSEPSGEPRDWRFELKLPLFDQRSDSALLAIKRHRLGFREVHPPRWVNNLYIDTPGLDLYFMSLSGASKRFKLRLRWYGEQDAVIDEARLEWKWRDSALGRKEVQPVALGHPEGDIDWTALRPQIEGELSPEARRRFEALRWPTVRNRYHRRYFYSKLSGVRLTLDERLAHAALPRAALRSHRGWLRHRRFAVIELKAPASHRRELTSAVEGFVTRPARYSKYVSAIRYFNQSLDET